jgi:ferric-dicitrate binding protein FerR (iron transport regulator)
MGKEHKQHAWNLIAKKLAGEASPAELAELEDLLRQNPELHYPLQTIADLWEHTGPADEKQAEEAFGRHLERIERLDIDYSPTLTVVTGEPEHRESRASQWWHPGRRLQDGRRKPSLRRKVLLLTPIALLLTGVILLFVHPTRHPAPAAIAQRPAPQPREIATNAGSRTAITLPDSTRVWLNAGSHIQYAPNFGLASREVSLTGEAFFDVAPDAARPFVIHTRKIDVRVLGTRFNLKSYPSDKTTEATLLRGSIEISIRDRPSDKIILKPNEKLVVSNDDSLLLRKTPYRHEPHPESLVAIGKPTYEQHSGAIIETSWMDNKLIFQDEEFGDLAKQMERWYGVSIRFSDPDMEELRFTGTFEKETIRQALDALKLTARFDYSLEGNQITIHD